MADMPQKAIFENQFVNICSTTSPKAKLMESHVLVTLIIVAHAVGLIRRKVIIVGARLE